MSKDRPFDPQPTLQGDLIQARPLRTSDHDALYAVARDPAIWALHPESDRYKEPKFRQFFESGIESGGCLIVSDCATKTVIGSSRFHGYQSGNSEVEIGWTFLAQRCWGGRYNRELKRLMVEHAFQYVDRVIFVVGETNFRSQRAVEKIGGRSCGARRDNNGHESLVYEITKACYDPDKLIG